MGDIQGGHCEKVPWKPEPPGKKKEPAVGRAEGRVFWTEGEHLQRPQGRIRMEGGLRVGSRVQKK